MNAVIEALRSHISHLDIPAILILSAVSAVVLLSRYRPERKIRTKRSLRSTVTFANFERRKKLNDLFSKRVRK
ncbi:MAG: hypothetical protein AMXMBFR16_00770 [Candidatus Uhrbacteria bacterium]|nr:MAG: hypothetical protein DCC77_00180 [Candidatus Uhrbacteria bacterium]